MAQLLANLGTSFPVDRRVFHPFDPNALDLDGAWKMKVTLRLAPASGEAAAHQDPGVTAAAREAVRDTCPPRGGPP